MSSENAVHKRLFSIFIIIALSCCAFLTGCSKEGSLDSKVNSNKTLVYTVEGEQNTFYIFANTITNRFVGKHVYTYEMEENGKYLKKAIWTWTLDQESCRKALENIQPDKVDEDAMNNIYEDLNQEMTYDYAVYSTVGGTSKKIPGYLTLIKEKSKTKNETTLTVMIDLTDKSLDLSEDYIQTDFLSNFISPGLFSESEHNYIINKKRLKKFTNTSTEKSKIYNMPILTDTFSVSKSYVKDSDLLSEKIKDQLN